MQFPEIRRALKRFFADKGEPITLDLKQFGTFSPTEAPGLQWLIENGYYSIAAALGGAPSWAGEAVNVTTALSHSVVWACNRIISESIGFLPANVMQERNGAKREATDHPMYIAMKNAPSDDVTAQAFSETGTSHCLLTGMAYAPIVRRSGTGTAIGFEPFLLPDQVKPDREKTGRKRLFYTIKESGNSDRIVFVNPGEPHQLFVMPGLGWNGIRGFDVISMGRNSIGSAIATERNLAAFWKKGGRRPFHVEWDRKFRNEDDFRQFSDDLRAVAGDPDRIVIMEDGRKLVPDALSMKDAQSQETRQFNVSEICRWFSISPHLVQDLSRATYSNIEHLALEFVKQTLSTWLVRWEQNFWRCVLTPQEKQQGYFLKHNLNALLRGEFQTRMAGYATALQNGFLSQDEVRDLEDRNPLPNGAGQGYHIQLNMQTLPENGGPLQTANADAQGGANGPNTTTGN